MLKDKVIVPINVERKVIEAFRKLSNEEGRTQGKMLEILLETYQKQQEVKKNV